MVLPANAVRDICRDRLVHQQMLRHESSGTQHQQHQRHAKQPRPGRGEQFFRLAFGHKCDDLADEYRDQNIQQRDNKADRKKPDEQHFCLASEMPIERRQAGRRFNAIRRRGWRQGFLKKPEH